MNRRELRDHFAGLAMYAQIKIHYPVKDSHYDNIAHHAYKSAEAMLAERDKRYGRVVPDGTDEPIREGE